MPRRPPVSSGYERIAQAEEEEDEDEYYVDDPNTGSRPSHSNTLFSPIQYKRQENRTNGTGEATPSRRRPMRRRQRSNSGVDIKAINARLERWADEIVSRLRIRRVKGKTYAEEQLEIHHSVFQAPDWIRPITVEELEAGCDEDEATEFEKNMSKDEFDAIVESVRIAIEEGKHPKLISQGSSGSYFARTPSGKVVGVFKPKDEEPYASRNPKWTKWIHRNLFPFFFGRACLIPNLSYVSEAAAHILDIQLRTNLVPYTDVVSLSSKAFHYDFWDRRAYYRKRKPLPEKAGSFQVFLKGYKDANIFLKENPWPDQNSDSLQYNARRKKQRPWRDACRTGSLTSGDNHDYENLNEGDSTAGDTSRSYSEEGSRQRGFWTLSKQQSLREELEKLVILDYIMRNTDRGLDNWMIKVQQRKEEINTAVKASQSQSSGVNRSPLVDTDDERTNNQPIPNSRATTPRIPQPTTSITLGAIDNSLSWPWKHPDAWRSYPFGWLFLPVSLIGQPFSESTRRHFLHLLTSKAWWSETQTALRDCFSIDADFKERMFARQLAVMKGQAWNVVETLKTPDHGPLELTRRARALVWDDLIDVPLAVPLNEPLGKARKGSRHVPEDSLDDRARKGNSGNRYPASSFEDDGMDISAVRPSTSMTLSNKHLDLLGIPSPAVEPNSQDINPFNTSRHTNSQESRTSADGAKESLSPASARLLAERSSKRGDQNLGGTKRPVLPGSSGTGENMRVSFDESKLWRSPDYSRRKRPQQQPNHHQRRISFSSNGSQQSAGFLALDDRNADEGDLGYGAAKGTTGNRKKVIVERLEIVKAKGPVFTWC